MSSISQLSDRDLLTSVTRAADDERRSTAQLIALLIELDTRKLYLGEGCSSLFTYCTQVLHLSEHAAYGRIEAARAARRFPLILTRLAEGTLTLTGVGLLASQLTQENHVEILDAARHKSKREVEHLVARLQPRPDVPAMVRKLPEPKPSPVLAPSVLPAVAAGDELVAERSHCPENGMPTPRVRPPEVTPLAPERYKIQFTVSRDTYEKLRQVQDLLRHQIPNGDPAAIFERALAVLLKDLSKTKLGAADRPRSDCTPARRSRHVPSAVKRAVWKRDGGRCAFTGAQGRCAETGFLEFHHVVPYAAGGETSVANLQLRCRSHNAYEAEREFGEGRPPVVREQNDSLG